MARARRRNLLTLAAAGACQCPDNWGLPQRLRSPPGTATSSRILPARGLSAATRETQPTTAGYRRWRATKLSI